MADPGAFMLEADQPYDELFSMWIDLAPRFGAVAEHFPRSLRCQRFVASFWAMELFFPEPRGPFLLEGCGWYLREYGIVSGRTRAQLDEHLSLLLARTPGAGPFIEVSRDQPLVDLGKSSFWAIEMFFTYTFSSETLIPFYRKRPGGVYGRREVLDRIYEDEISRAWKADRYFWSPELPEVKVRPRTLDLGVVTFVKVAAGPSWISVFLLLLCLALPASAQTLLGTVSRVTDGDTLVVGEARIRLHGIDAPESRQGCFDRYWSWYWCGETARDFLASLAPAGSSISCRIKDVDRYGRLVAVCSVAQRATSDLSREMVMAGWAVAYRKYSSTYVDDELLARQARRGMWAGTFKAPEEWRRAHSGKEEL